MLLLVSILVNNVVSVKADDFFIELENYIYDYSFQKLDKDVAVYGNLLDFSSNEFIEITEQGTDKIYIHYRTDYNVILPYDLFVVVKKQGKYYHYEYTVNSNGNAYLSNGIKSYLRLNGKAILSNYNSDTNPKLMSTGPYSNVPTTFIDSIVTANFTRDFPGKGYIVSRIAVSEYRPNNVSSIFITKVISSFVPGIVAYENGDSSYQKWKNDNGYVHITLEQAFDRNEEYYHGIRYGATPFFKDFWPNNQPTTVTIGSSLTVGAVLGYSTKDGFGVNGNISYGYSKSITYSNPHVNAQMSPNLKIAQWSYKYTNNSPWTYDQESNYMYEISSIGGSMLYGDVRLKIDYKFVVDRGLFYSQQTNMSSLDLMIRIQNRRIYNFSNGMI